MEQFYETLDPQSELASLVLDYLTNPHRPYCAWEHEAIMVKAGQTFSKYTPSITVLELYFEGLYTWNDVIEEVSC